MEKESYSSVLMQKGMSKFEQEQESELTRFVVTIVWALLSVGIAAYAMLLQQYVLGAGAECVFFLITIVVPYLRRRDTYTRWFGWFALLLACWLLYMNGANF